VQTLCQSFGTIEAIYLRGATLVANEAFKESSRSARRMAVAAGKIDPNGTVMANVRFAAASEALAAAEAITGQQIEGRFVRASLATQKEFPKDRTLFIGSVPNVLTEDQLFMVLKQAGVPVAAVRIPISKETGRARGVAFALMPSREAVAEAARKTVKIDVDGEEKKLLLARPLDKKKLAKRADKRQTALGRKGRQDKRAAAKGKVPAKSD
jgi:RNA recognition motif-containing protein